MAPRPTKNRTPPSNPNGMFAGMVVLLVETRVQTRRLQIWKQKLVQTGAAIEDHLSKRITHVFAMNSEALLKQVAAERLRRFKGATHGFTRTTCNGELLFCIAQVSSDTKIEDQKTQVVKGANRRLLPLLDCGGLCKVRCGLHSRPNLCIRACGTCCARCKCVPPGTSGNREVWEVLYGHDHSWQRNQVPVGP